MTEESADRATDRDFAGRNGVALVVGGSGGLGGAVARLLLERGSGVVITYRTDAGAPDRLGVPGLRLDVADPDRAQEVLESVVRRFGGVHTLVHAAGPHVPMRHLSAVTPREFRAQLLEDSAGFFNVISAALPALRAARGSVVAVTTAATARFPARDGLSAVPKGSVEALVRGIAVEEGRYGVRANCVGPGMLVDGMAERLTASGDLSEAALGAARANTPLRRFGTAQDVAEAVCFLASDRAGFVSGQKLDVDGGYGA